MPKGTMLYFLRTTDGKEYGPIDQDLLVQWANAGRITPGCKVRNSLMKAWHPVEKVNFLQNLVREEEGSKRGKFDPPERRRTGHSLLQSGPFKCVPAPHSLRSTAATADMVLVAAVVAVLFVGTSHLIRDVELPAEMCFLGFTFVAVVFTLLYYTLTMGVSAQTVGQWFAGTMVIRGNGEPVLLGRAFVFTVLSLLLWPTSGFFMFILPGRRALQDALTGVRVTRINLRDTL